MVRHTILFKLKNTVNKSELENVFSGILNLTGLLPGIIAITGGKCHFHEAKKSPLFSHGFSIDFQNLDSRDAFLASPLVLPVTDLLISISEGGNEGIVGFDFGAQPLDD